MPVFTFITDFQGGTYICQKQAGDLRTACFMWKDDISIGAYIPKLKVKSFLKSFKNDIDDLPPIALDDLRNVWVFSLLVGDDQLDLQIIQTDTMLVESSIMAAIS